MVVDRSFKNESISWVDRSIFSRAASYVVPYIQVLQ